MSPIGFNNIKPSANPPPPAYYDLGTVEVDDSGETVGRPLLMCARCGVFVLDRIVHDDYHGRLR